MNDRLNLFKNFSIIRKINETKIFEIFHCSSSDYSHDLLLFLKKEEDPFFNEKIDQIKLYPNSCMLKILDHFNDFGQQFFVCEFIEAKNLGYLNIINKSLDDKIYLLFNFYIQLDLQLSEQQKNIFLIKTEDILFTDSEELILIPYFGYIEPKPDFLKKCDPFYESLVQISYHLIMETETLEEKIEDLSKQIDSLQRYYPSLAHVLQQVILENSIKSVKEFVTLEFSKKNLFNLKLESYTQEFTDKIFLNINKKNHINIICGPSHCGKTTVLLECLTVISKINKNIVYLSAKDFLLRDYSFLHESLKIILSNLNLKSSDFEHYPDFFKEYLNKEFYLKFENINIHSTFHEHAFIEIINHIFSQYGTEMAIIIDDFDYLDEKSIQYIYKYNNFFKQHAIQLIFTINEKNWQELIDLFKNKYVGLVFIRPLYLQESESYIKSFLECNQNLAEKLNSKIYVKSDGQILKTKLILQWLKQQNVLINNEQIDDSIFDRLDIIKNDFIISERLIENHKQYQDLLLFFAFSKRLIPFTSLAELFTNSDYISKIINELEDNSIIYSVQLVNNSNSKYYKLTSDDFYNIILNLFEQADVIEMIQTYLSIHELRESFNYELALQFLKRTKSNKECVEVLIKYGHLYQSKKEYEKALLYYENAIELIDQQSIEISPTIKLQLLEFVAKNNFKLKNVLKADQYFFKLSLIQTINLDQKINILIHLLELSSLNNNPENFNVYNNLLKEVGLAEIENPYFLNYYNYIHACNFYNSGNFIDAQKLLDSLINKEKIHQDIFQSSILLYIKIFESISATDKLQELFEFVIQRKLAVVDSLFLLDTKMSLAKLLSQLKLLEKAKEEYASVYKFSCKIYQFEKAGRAALFLSKLLLETDKESSIIPLLEDALAAFNKSTHIEESALILGELAIIYKNMGLINQAITSELKSYQINFELQQKGELIYSLANLAHTHILIFNFDKASDYLNQALIFAKQSKNLKGYCFAALYMAFNETSKENYAKASQYLNEALNLITGDQDENYTNYIYYHSFYLYKKKQYDKAKSDLKFYFDNKLDKKNTKYVYNFIYLIGCILIGQNKYSEARILLNKAFKMAAKNEHMLYQFIILLKIHEINVNEGREQFISLAELKMYINKICINIKDEILKVSFLESSIIAQIQDSLDDY